MRTHLLRFILSNRKISKTGFHTSTIHAAFYEPQRSGYELAYDPNVKVMTPMEKLRHMKDEIKLFYKEQTAVYKQDNLSKDPAELNVIWKFSEGQKSRDQWVITCDSDYNQGYSTAKLDMSSNGTAMFHGLLNPVPPKDGKVTYAGFCNITSVPLRKSFWRTTPLELLDYNTLVLRVRGDGRKYTLNLLCRGSFDLTYNDLYFYVMYTRGGPYWQDVEIPFSKFAFTSKGSLQDSQPPLPTMVTNFGISIGDKISAQFKLEIDYIGIKYKAINEEESAYETYDVRDIRW